MWQTWWRKSTKNSPKRKRRSTRAEKQSGGEEIGDLLFAVVNLARKSNLDAETTLQRATDKFVRRFNALENELQATGKSLGDVSLADLDEIWNAHKKRNTARVDRLS